MTSYSRDDGFFRDLAAHFICSHFHIRPWDRRGYFTLYDPVETDAYFFQRLGIWKSHPFAARASPRENLRRMREKGITFFAGFPNLLYFLARENLTDGADRYRLKRFFTWVERLSSDLRELIAHSFQTAVADVYGISEAGPVAFECGEGRGYHLTPHCRVEIVREGRSVGGNTPGGIVVTPLHSFAMPFVRYNTHDRGEIDFTPCDCGLPTPRLKNLEGRASTFFIGKDGEKVSSAQMSFSRQFLGEVLRFTIVQRAAGELEILVVLSPSVDRHDFEKRLREALASRFPGAFDFAITCTDRMEPGQQGKFLGGVSTLPSEEG